VRVDRDELDVALLNLVVNAKDAMPDGGVVTIEAKNLASLPSDVVAGDLRGPVVALSVKDEGLGMSAAVVERAFEPFFTTKPNTKGSGLGLSQVYGFCQQAGGVPAIRSAAGSGTAITLYLPKWNAPPVDESAAQQGPAPASHSGHALLVEDNAAVGELARDYLEDIGFAVTWAHQGSSALQMFSATSLPFDLVVSDIVMPGPVNGVQLARDIKRLSPATPILLMTGYAPYLAGAVDEFPILRKPFTRPSLEAALARAFQSVALPEAADTRPQSSS
jgi:CheY-like chemotaxis protein